MRIQKYLSVFQIAWQTGFVYRLNFVMWRVRTVIQMLTIYFLWLAVFRNKSDLFGYSSQEMLTYILIAALVRAVVFSSRSVQLQADIASGDLSNFLTKPIGIFKYWLTRDIADKCLNLIFSVGEILVLWVLLRPPLLAPASVMAGLAFGGLVIGAMWLYFFFSLIISLSVFWMPEGAGWPQRFFILVMMEFFAGGLFPLDILSGGLYKIVGKLPTAYMLSVPIQVYLGRMPVSEWPQIGIEMLAWIVFLFGISVYLFKRGLIIYGAYGK